jgi:hypothetical protein
MDLGTEYAMTKTPDGAPVVRQDALLSLLKGYKAIAAQPNQRPPLGPDGQPMLWNEKRGWFPRDSRRSPTTAARSSGRPLKELEARQRSVGRRIRHDDRDAELHAERELIDGASSTAWKWCRLFSRGEPWPGVDATDDQRTGWRLYNRGLVSLRPGS